MNKSIISAFVLSAVALVGCGKQEILDYRNSEVSNQTIFREGADEGFTGRVNNFPLRQTFLEESAIVKTQFLLSSANDGKNVDLVNAVCTFETKKGIIELPMDCVAPQSRMKVRLEEKGSAVIISATYPDSEDEAGKFTTLDGKLHGDSYTKRQFGHSHNQEVKYHLGEVVESKTYHQQTGQLAEIAAYNKAGRHGEQARFDIDGVTKLYEAHFENGVQVGRMLRVNTKTGTYIEQFYTGGYPKTVGEGKFVEGKLVPSSEVVATAPKLTCVDQWTNAYHKEVGEDELVTADMISEWEGKCRSGQLPA